MTTAVRNLLQQIRQHIRPQPPQLPAPGDVQAAVLLALTDNDFHPDLILTRRAASLNTHAGEVALPGGKRDPGDPDLAHTALRESEEEIALPAREVDMLGALPQAQSRWGLQVVPFVGIFPGQTELVPNPAEIETIFRVPLRYFLEHPQVEIRELAHQGVLYRVPGFQFEDQIIWGLTAHFIADFCNRVFDAGFDHFRPVPITHKGNAT